MSKPKKKPRIRVSNEALLKRKKREFNRERDLELIGHALGSLEDSELIKSISLDIKGHYCYPIYKEDAEYVTLDIWLWAQDRIEFARKVNQFYRDKWKKAEQAALKLVQGGVQELQEGMKKAVSDAFEANKKADWGQIINISKPTVYTKKGEWTPKYGEEIQYIAEGGLNWKKGYYWRMDGGKHWVSDEPGMLHCFMPKYLRRKQGEPKSGKIKNTIDHSNDGVGSATKDFTPEDFKPSKGEKVRAYVSDKWGVYTFHEPHFNGSGFWVEPIRYDGLRGAVLFAEYVAPVFQIKTPEPIKKQKPATQYKRGDSITVLEPRYGVFMTGIVDRISENDIFLWCGGGVMRAIKSNSGYILYHHPKIGYAPRENEEVFWLDQNGEWKAGTCVFVYEGNVSAYTVREHMTNSLKFVSYPFKQPVDKSEVTLPPKK